MANPYHVEPSTRRDGYWFGTLTLDGGICGVAVADSKDAAYRLLEARHELLKGTGLPGKPGNRGKK